MEVTLGSLMSVPIGEGRTFDIGTRKIAGKRSTDPIYRAAATHA